MCRAVGLGEELGVAVLQVVLPLCALPLAVAILAWRREERWAALLLAGWGVLMLGALAAARATCA